MAKFGKLYAPTLKDFTVQRDPGSAAMFFKSTYALLEMEMIYKEHKVD